jgi:hypothetical protein
MGNVSWRCTPKLCKGQVRFGTLDWCAAIVSHTELVAIQNEGTNIPVQAAGRRIDLLRVLVTGMFESLGAFGLLVLKTGRWAGLGLFALTITAAPANCVHSAIEGVVSHAVLSLSASFNAVAANSA